MKNKLFWMKWCLFYFYLIQVLPEGKCGHRNVLSKRQVWMSIFHIINFKKKNPGHRVQSNISLIEFEDTKGAIRIRISKNRQHNDQKKKYKRTNNDLQNIHIKLKLE
jgi:hypothetical protein